MSRSRRSPGTSTSTTTRSPRRCAGSGRVEPWGYTCVCGTQVVVVSKCTVAVSGAWSYSGRQVAARLLRCGYTVVSLTNRRLPDPDPHAGAVRRIPWDFAPGALERSLQGVDVLACAYWTRHDRAPVGHRGSWPSHARAVEHSARIIEAAVAAGVSRLVWTSIANPGLDPDLSYYVGKAAVERLVERSGLPHAILRPACFFGPGGILIENVAWAARRLPCFPIPAGPRYRIRPIHVDDYARAVVDAVAATGTFVRDATGPDRIEFGELVDYLASLTGGRARVVRLPIPACAGLYRLASGVMRETILTTDELKGLARNRLDSVEAPVGRIALRAWLSENISAIGSRFVREPRR